MRVFRRRFKLWELMAAVAVVGLALGFLDWHSKMRKLSIQYKKRASEYGRNYISWSPEWEKAESLRPKSAWVLWRDGMAEKYTRAARYPWLPVSPDPPEPSGPHW